LTVCVHVDGHRSTFYLQDTSVPSAYTFKEITENEYDSWIAANAKDEAATAKVARDIQLAELCKIHPTDSLCPKPPLTPAQSKLKEGTDKCITLSGQAYMDCMKPYRQTQPENK